MKLSKKRISLRLPLLLSMACLSTLLWAEPSAIVKGRVTDSKNQPVQFATATLVNSTTKALVKGEVCNDKGEFVIEKVNPGEYTLSVSMMGYAKNESEKVVINNRKNVVVEKNIVLNDASQQLNGVEVVAKKNFIEQTVDKMVINPEASITTASENVYEILRKLPGVTIDNNDNVSLKGKSNVKILIDEKPTYLSATQLAAMLKGMQGKNVDKIEIIENPSARYDAEGNSGIINIKTKHDKARGFNGSVFTGLEEPFGLNGGLDLNLNYGKLNLYGNYAMYSWSGWSGMDATRRYTSAGLEGSQLIHTKGDYQGLTNNYKVGADYYIKKNHVLSFMFRGSNGHNSNNDENTTSFADKNLNTDSSLVSNAASKDRWNNYTTNLNYKWDIDTTGQSLTVDADYALFYYNSPRDQTGIYYNAAGNSLNHDILFNIRQGNTIKIWTAKVDYVLPVGKKFNFESGLKTSIVNADNNMDMTGDLTQHDHFLYDESIQAAYINGRAQLNKTMLQLGLRAENTITKGNSVNTNQVNDTSYLKIFPSLFVQQKLNTDNTINFQYSYRIGRPSYHMLNPFKWMIDPYTYNVGNPYLKSQFTNSASLSHNYKGALITSLGFNYTDGIFIDIIRQDDAARTIYQTVENLSSSLDLNMSETFQFQPLKWWRLNGTLTGMYKEITFDSNAGSKLNQWSFNGNISNNLNLPCKLEMELSGYYSSKQLISNIILCPRYTADFGIQRKILKDQGSIKISVSDIFKTGNSKAYARYDNVNMDVLNTWDSRKLRISFNYRFGKDDFKTRSNRSTASSEEQSRSSK